MAVHRQPQQASSHRRLFFYIPPILILIMVAALLFFIDTSDTGPARDGDLCPVPADGITGRAEFLLDLHKPTGGLGGSLAMDALRALTLDLDADTELRVFAVTDNAGAPRQLLDRLCKPYGNADLAFEGAKDRRQQVRDCDDLPAQLPNHVRSNAERFCAQRTQLGERIEQLAAAPAAPVASAYLVEALEETGLELAELSGRRSLYVFSDMLQHSSWYSHLELGWNGWSFADFIEMRTAQDALVGPRPPAIAGLDVTIFYMPREGVTELPRVKSVHKRFWRDYFAPASPGFREQALAPAYQAAPLMNRLTDAELAQQERQRLRQEREEAERLLAQVEQERTALEEARRQAEVEERAQQARVDELRRQRELLQAEEASRAAAQAEASGRAEDESRPATESQAQAEAQEDAEGQAELASQAEAEQGALAVQEAAEQEPAPAVVEEPPAAVAQAPAPEPPAAAAVPEDQAVDLADAGGADAAALEPCGVRLKPRFQAAVPPYPGRNRIDYGSATIVVQFTLNEQGETVDDAVAAISERSVAERADYLNLFVREVLNLVRRWEFEFDESDAGACARSQQLTTQFQFSYGN